MTPSTLTLSVNGREHTVTARPDASLLYILRNDLQLNGPKYGCGQGECGACMVTIDGKAARSCSVPAGALAGHPVVTLEGLAQGEALHAVQQAFVDEQAAQCGYCINGMIMTTVALLARNPRPDDAAIRTALAHTLCRCGTHVEILRAVRKAAGRPADGSDEVRA